MSINVNRDIDDAFYRYKMPKLIAKVEGKGNGIKTVVVNMIDIAKALYRKASYPTKYFGCELGAQVYVDEKNDRYIVNGSHDASKLQELLHGFIKKFVLCQKCDNPETVLTVRKKGGIVTTKCKACGHSDQLDVIHRVTQFIIKNPPTDEASGASCSKSGTKTVAKQGGDEEGNGDGGEEGAGQEVEGGVEVPPEADVIDEEVEWGEETTEEAQKKRMAELDEAVKVLTMDDSLERTPAEKADLFYLFLKKCVAADNVLEKKNEIKKEADRLNLGERPVMILMEVLLSSADSVLDNLESYRSLFVLFTRYGESVSSKRAQRYTLGAMEKTIERFDILQKACHILKKLYDSDIVEEDVILEWANKGPSRRFVEKELSGHILEKCQPMILWLREAEEEESDEEDDDEENDDEENDDEEVNVRASNGSSHFKRPDINRSAATKIKNNVHDEDELDIDAI